MEIAINVAMLGAVDGRSRLSESLQAYRDVFRNPQLRRIELALVGSITGDWAYAIALSVFAYEHGGTAAVGLVALLRFWPSAAAAPFLSMLGDRYRRERVMVTCDLLRALAIGGAAATALLGGPPLLAIGLAVSVQLIATAFRPAQAALLPSLATRPEELTAANVASSSIESVGSFAGPALGGLLLALTSTGVVFASTSLAFLWSALMVSRIRGGARPERGESGGLAHELLAGARAIGGESRLRLIVGLYGAQTLVAGALNVLIVVTSLRVLDEGRAGVGYLNAAVGVGGVIGAGAAIALVGRKRLASDFGLGLVFWGLPIVLLGVWPQTAFAVFLLGLVGIGNTIVDVAGLTVLQRTVADDVLARVFGVLESLLLATIGLGAILAPAAVALLGPRGALIAFGALLPVLAVLASPKLRALDASAVTPTRQLELLSAIPMFRPLPPQTLERLAGRLQPVHVPAGGIVVRKGEAGDRFYVVVDGELDVAVDGKPAPPLGPGSHFGEIALLRDVPRTATVQARTEVELFALDRDEFIASVTGHPQSRAEADAVIGARLGSLRAGAASV